MTSLNKDAILSASPCQKDKVEMPEWGGHVYVSAVSAADWMDVQDAMAKDKDEAGKLATAPWVGLMLVRTIVDENGQRLFDDGDAPELMKKPLVLINRLYHASDKLNDFTGRGIKAAEKNSSEGAGEDSPTPSLAN